MFSDKKNFLIFGGLVFVVILFSYVLYAGGITNKLKGNIESIPKEEMGGNDYPIIDLVINSSGEKQVNNDVAITIKASSKYKITKFYYSFDKKNWKDNFIEVETGEEASAKVVFEDTMNSKIYIKVENEAGLSSFYYETIVNIDKILPTIEKKADNFVISDNDSISKIQYSNDSINWEDIMLEDNIKNKKISKDEITYKYVRAVDKVGNISKVVEVN